MKLARLSTVFFLLALAACATVPKPEETTSSARSAVESLVAPHRDRAAQLQSQGELRAALNEWKVALTIDPKDRISTEGKEKLQEKIDQEIAAAMGRGRDALKRGVQLEARRHFLRALA